LAYGFCLENRIGCHLESPPNIRDHAILQSAARHLEELIDACKVRGAVYGVDPELTRDVIRKAKGLQTSLGKLLAAVDDPDHQPAREEEKPLPKDRLSVQLYQDRCLAEVARFISYGGRTSEQVRQFMTRHRERYGDRAAWAFRELTTIQNRTHLTVLNPKARRSCRVLLGPPPESPKYQEYWQRQGQNPPVEHRTPLRDDGSPDPPIEDRLDHLQERTPGMGR
jgi:hypothetical protein